MPILLGTAYNEVTGTETPVWGDQLLREFELDTQISSKTLKWYRDAVADVRQSMKIPYAVVWINRVQIYKTLFESSWPASRERHGAVAQASKTLVFSQVGWKDPKTVFEEVAHSLSRRLPLQQADARPEEIESLCLHELQFQNGRRPSSIFSPIRCHLDIYSAMSRSKTYPAFSDAQRLEVENVIRMLESERPCRRQRKIGWSQGKPCAC